MENLEASIYEIGNNIIGLIGEDKPSIWRPRRWESELLKLCMQNEDFKTQILRFIDVYPVLPNVSQMLNHFEEYLSGIDLPYVVQMPLAMAKKSQFRKLAFGLGAQYIINRMARRFIAGSNLGGVVRTIHRLAKKGMPFTLDYLGEKTTSETDAEQYMNTYLSLIDELTTKLEPGSVNLSLKLSSLYSQFDPADPKGTAVAVKNRLRNIFRKAQLQRAFVTIDAETYYMLPLTYAIYQELLEEEEFRDFNDSGIVIQAYLKDAEDRLNSLLHWANARNRQLSVRLVKGAYWDYEIIHARQLGWDIPVFMEKNETDAQFEKLTRTLMDSHEFVFSAIASHNIRSIAHALSIARQLNVPAGRFELQVLYGMGDIIKRALVKIGQPPRNYIPYGELIPGMGYLVRRILENTSNESFLRTFVYEHIKNQDELLKSPPHPNSLHIQENSGVSAVVKDSNFRNVPVADFSQEQNRAGMENALKVAKQQFGNTYPLIINGEKMFSGDFICSTNPSDPSEVIGKVALANTELAEKAIYAAAAAATEWGGASSKQRSVFLLNAAAVMRERRFNLAALEVYEAGKPWKEADADVCEAIDFLEFYAREMIRLGSSYQTQEVPGEINESIYIPRGIAVIISPWNFPLAILTGMTSAALVTGNAVIMKPASQTPVIAAELMDIFTGVGLPKGILQYLPGRGSETGEYLIRHPMVDIIAFTGSLEVGMHILDVASTVRNHQKNIKKVIAELGGKNAIIVDSSADIDEALQGIITSAFGYCGQKCSACSRVVVLEPVYDTFLKRLTEGARSIKVGPAEDPASFMGPLIDHASLEKFNRYKEIGKNEGRLIYESPALNGEGFFAGPVILADVKPNAVITRDEIFAPILSVMKAADFDEALRIANDSQYGLTAGLYSRTPSHIERFRRGVEAGNRYINKKITGAIVQRQPFGGYKMSGVGSKAGGTDYLLQFMIQVSVSENTMRHGFAPLKKTDI